MNCRAGVQEQTSRALPVQEGPVSVDCNSFEMRGHSRVTPSAPLKHDASLNCLHDRHAFALTVTRTETHKREFVAHKSRP